MTDTAQGTGWWQASDGNWYPPQSAAPPPPPPPPVKPAKKIYKRVWFWVVMAVVVFFGGCVAIIAGTGTAVHEAIHQADTQKHTIVYTVTGSGTVNSISYSRYDNGNKGTSEISNAQLPWTKTVTGSGLFSFYSLSASLGQNGGTLSCTITIDGKQVASHTATGAFTFASCNGYPS